MIRVGQKQLSRRLNNNQVEALPDATSVDHDPKRQADDRVRAAFLGAMEQVSDLVMVTDPEGTIEYVNRSFETVTGYSRREVIGRAPSILKSGEHDDDFYKLLWVTILRGEQFRAAMVNRRKDGSFYCENRTITPIRDVEGHVSVFVATGTNVTQRARPKRQVSGQTMLDRAFTGIVPGLVYRTFLRGKPHTDWLNGKLLQMTGFIAEELAGSDEFPLYALMPTADAEKRRAKIDDAVRGNRAFRLRYRIKHKVGRMRHFFDCGETVTLADGSPSHIDGIILDVTSRIRLREALRDSRRDIGALSAQLLGVHETERKRVASELHDGVGQILTSIKMRVERAEFALGEGLVEESAKDLKAIVSMIRNAMVEVRRISMDLRPSILDDLGVVATVAWFCRSYSDTWSGIRVDLDVAVAEREVPERLKTAIYRVLQEGMNNVAVHAAANLIRVRLAGSVDGIELVIEDNGSGFDVEQTLVDAGRQGLGLVSMRERVRMCGGSLLIQSTKRIGTIVRAVWPHEPTAGASS
jgi:PAS domain S-box-containing protein